MKDDWRVIIAILILVVIYVVFFENSSLSIKSSEKNNHMDIPVPKPTLTPKQLDKNAYDQGYQWAEDSDISDVRQCVNGSKAFINGCQTYVQDSSDDAKQDSESKE